VQGRTDFFHMGAVRADDFMELVAGDAELFGPISDVGGHFGIDFLRVVGAFGVFFVDGVRFVRFGGFVVFRQWEFLSVATLDWMREWWVGMYFAALRRNVPRVTFFSEWEGSGESEYAAVLAWEGRAGFCGCPLVFG